MSAHLSLTLPVNFWQSVDLSAAVMTTPAEAHNILINMLEDLPMPRTGPPNAAGNCGPVVEDFPLHAMRNLLRAAAEALLDGAIDGRIVDHLVE